MPLSPVFEVFALVHQSNDYRLPPSGKKNLLRPVQTRPRLIIPSFNLIANELLVLLKEKPKLADVGIHLLQVK